ncbi:DsrE family protein [Thioalkalivibrio sp. HK1]|uniref:DsrE family protein n=1 Tax=Thioalkalivibrio sp. HK1 TaxID=1469245 RepID=UPI000472C720|nr:DsrE family protein [Thioalkalivibrio sp. HK1]
MSNRISTLTLLLSALSLCLLTAGPATAQDKADHQVAIHLDDNDPKRMNMALNNIANLRKYYDSIGETVEIELVAYGPGLHIFREDTSPVKDRIEAMALGIDNLTFSACGNTHSAMSRASGKDVDLLDEVNIVPSGVVRLVALQERGYSYIRP